jgi:hypothetical protein
VDRRNVLVHPAADTHSNQHANTGANEHCDVRTFPHSIRDSELDRDAYCECNCHFICDGNRITNAISNEHRYSYLDAHARANTYSDEHLDSRAHFDLDAYS